MNEDLSQSGGGEPDSTFAATIQHIELLHDKQLRLLKARQEAEEQLLHQLGSAYRCGDIGVEQLLEVSSRYKFLNLDGRSKRWNQNVGINWHSMSAMSDQGMNGPEGTWVGEWPCAYYSPAPGRGVAVVYVLFDEANTPCYVGSSHNFRTRLKAHDKAGKRFVRWQAYPCRDREHAYQLEDRLLKERLPHLNRKASR